MKRTILKVILLPYIFVLMNWAPVAGLYYFARGRSLGIWSPVAVRHT